MNRGKILLIFTVFWSAVVQGQVPACSRLPTSAQLLTALKGRPNFGEQPSRYRIGCNVNDSIKNRILHLLNWKWSQQEIEEYLSSKLDNTKYSIKEADLARKISAGNDSVFVKVKDSLRTETRGKVLLELSRYHEFNVANNLILTAGFLGFQEAVPILQTALMDTIHYEKEFVELALAKLGNSNLQNKVIAESKYNAFSQNWNWREEWFGSKKKLGKCNKLLYLCTQESIYSLYEWLDTTKRYRAYSEGNVTLPYAHELIWYLSHIILNKDYLVMANWVEVFETNSTDNKLILACREWLIKNKGRYELNKNFCPYF